MCTFKMCLASLETDTSFNTMLWSRWLRYHIDHTPVAFSWLSMWNWAAEASTLKYLWAEDMNVASPESGSLCVLYRSSKWGNGSRNHYLCGKRHQQLSLSLLAHPHSKTHIGKAEKTQPWPGQNQDPNTTQNTTGAIPSDYLVHTYL